MIADIISMEAIMDICQLRITAFVMLRNEKNIAKKYPFFNKSTVGMKELANQNLSIQPFFESLPDFVVKLGSAYLMELTEKMFGNCYTLTRQSSPLPFIRYIELN